MLTQNNERSYNSFLKNQENLDRNWGLSYDLLIIHDDGDTLSHAGNRRIVAYNTDKDLLPLYLVIKS